jgi:hypothetical protein
MKTESLKTIFCGLMQQALENRQLWNTHILYSIETHKYIFKNFEVIFLKYLIDFTVIMFRSSFSTLSKVSVSREERKLEKLPFSIFSVFVACFYNKCSLYEKKDRTENKDFKC